MDKVTILSRTRFLAFIPPVPAESVVAIRIGDRLPVQDATAQYYTAMLPLAFYDVAAYADQIDPNTPLGSNRLTAADKTRIDAFIDRHRDCHFVVHCEQGISRSAAVGYYILTRLHADAELTAKKASALYSPNIEVFGVLMGTPYTRETAQALRQALR